MPWRAERHPLPPELCGLPEQSNGWTEVLARLARLSSSQRVALQIAKGADGGCVCCQSLEVSGAEADGCGAEDCLWAKCKAPGPSSGMRVVALWQSGEVSAHLLLEGAGPEGRGPDSAALEPFLPLLRQASQLCWKQVSQARRLDLLEGVADRNQAGMLLLDSAGLVEYRNRSAEGMLSSRDGLTLQDSRLHALQPKEDRGLQKLLNAALMPSDALGCQDGFVSVARPSGRAPYRIEVSPLDIGQGPEALRRAATVFIYDSSAPREVTQRQMEGCFGLTPREAELAVQLTLGASVDEAAASMGVSRNTARVHLQGLFRKTGTHRQVDLLRALFSAAGVSATGMGFKG